MIEEASLTDEASASNLSSDVSPTARLPLLRLRVDYTGASVINVQRFGSQFVGKVASRCFLSASFHHITRLLILMISCFFTSAEFRLRNLAHLVCVSSLNQKCLFIS